MKCFECGTEMTTKRENVPYESLPGAVLIGVEVSRCPSCGEYEVAIPAIDELNKVLAHVVISKKVGLSGGEVRFLRTYLGLSGADFAKRIRSSPATVSRWENGTQPIGHHSDLLLRAMVVMDKKVKEYPISTFDEIEDKKAPAKGQQYALKPAAKTWKPTQLAA